MYRAAVGAVEVARPRRATMKTGVAADGAERAHGAVHAAGDDALGALEQRTRDGIGHWLVLPGHARWVL